MAFEGFAGGLVLGYFDCEFPGQLLLGQPALVLRARPATRPPAETSMAFAGIPREIEHSGAQRTCACPWSRHLSPV